MLIDRGKLERLKVEAAQRGVKITLRELANRWPPGMAGPRTVPGMSYQWKKIGRGEHLEPAIIGGLLTIFEEVLGREVKAGALVMDEDLPAREKVEAA